MRQLLAQIVVDGTVLSALYGLGAAGFALIFGVSGVLNLAHGAVLLVAAMTAWAMASELGLGPYLSQLAGVGGGVIAAYLTYYVVIRPLQRSRKIPDEEREIFVLTATLLWAIMISELLAHFFTATSITVPPLVQGVSQVLGVRTPTNELAVGAVAWLVIGALWLFVHGTRTGKAVWAASINPRGLALLGFDLERIYRWVWGIYGIMGGVAGVLLASFLGANPARAGDLTASAFSIVVLGGLGSIFGSLLASYLIGFIETLTAYLVAPSLRDLPGLIILVLVLYLRPRGLFGRR
jgi:branched-chain amino acid transport system permease protein